MSFRNRFQQQGVFRETLTYEDIIKRQMETCIDRFNEGDPTSIMFAVEALVLAIEQKMADETFANALQDLDRRWEVKQREIMADYRKELKQAVGCPDLVPMPDLRPDMDYWKEMFTIALDLFGRKGLLLKNKVDQPL